MMMEKQNSVTMEYFLETSHLDADTAALLKKYDKDGNGSFSKDEVAAIIMDLREAMRSNQELGSSNKLFKRLLIASCVFCVLLLASMFGLSYAVAALTAKTDVDSSGALTKAGSSEHVSTDARAEVHIVNYNADGNLCVTMDEINAMVEEVHSGKNVMMETINGGNTTVNQISGNGMTIYETENGPVPCFDLGNGKAQCFVPGKEGCTGSNSAGRKLSVDERRQLDDDAQCSGDKSGEAGGRRRLCTCSGDKSGEAGGRRLCTEDGGGSGGGCNCEPLIPGSCPCS